MKLTFFFFLIFTLNFSIAQEYCFSPKGSATEVIFPGKPEITSFKAGELSSNILNGIRANFLNPKELSLLRAEYAHLNYNSDNLTDEVLSKSGFTQAEVSGFSGTEVELLKTKFGRCVSIRGYKTLDNTYATYEIRNYYNAYSLMAVYVAAPSKIYPTNCTHDFLKSIRVKKK